MSKEFEANLEDSERIRQLVKRARVLGLQNRADLPDHVRKILADADAEGRMLTADELKQLCLGSNVDASSLANLQNEANALVDQAKQTLLAHQPELIRPGGALFPSQRAEACWRDCYHFLRVCCYAVATAQPKLTDPEGMEGLKDLYVAMGVPIPAMLFALGELRTLASASLKTSSHIKEAKLLDAAFLELETEIGGFSVKSY
ncbi:MAG: phycobilisome polypeptide [Prochlorococcus sp.]|jgi:hypothetical protein|nr:phycobilisome polypeptide [Prochlorococcus sp.]CAI8154721.1 MAG: C-phycocyanin beta chain [Prochlorococcus marinus str. MIT 9215]